MTRYTKKELQYEAMRALRETRAANPGQRFALRDWEVILDGPACSCISVHMVNLTNATEVIHNTAI